jgi:hypothetical protein
MKKFMPLILLFFVPVDSKKETPKENELEAILEKVYAHKEVGPMLRHLAAYSKPMPVHDNGYWEAETMKDLDDLGRISDQSILEYADDFKTLVVYYRKKYGIPAEEYDAMIERYPEKRFMILFTTKPEPFRIHR